MIRRLTSKELAALEPAAVLLDVREPGEFAGKRLPRSVNVPLSRLDAAAPGLPKDGPVVVLCRSGRRSETAARRLRELGFSDVRVLEGGLETCGALLEAGPGGVWAMERQVRLAAGSLVLLGGALGWAVHPAGWLLSLGIGAGLVYSAVTDTCGMAAALALLPWNRRGPRCGP